MEDKEVLELVKSKDKGLIKDLGDSIVVHYGGQGEDSKSPSKIERMDVVEWIKKVYKKKPLEGTVDVLLDYIHNTIIDTDEYTEEIKKYYNRLGVDLHSIREPEIESWLHNVKGEENGYQLNQLVIVIRDKLKNNISGEDYGKYTTHLNLFYGNIQLNPSLYLGDNKIPIYEGAPCILYARGGAGKSLLLQRVLMKETVNNKSLKVCLLSGEDTKTSINHLMGHTFRKAYEDNQFYLLNPGMLDGEGVLRFIEGTDYNLYVIDPLSTVARGDYEDIEVSNSVAGRFMFHLTQVCQKNNKSVIITHHVNKANSGYGDSRNASRGSSAIVDNARQGLYLTSFGNMIQDSITGGKGDANIEAKSEAFNQWREYLKGEKSGVMKNPFKYKDDLLATHYEWIVSDSDNMEILDILKLQVEKSNYTATGDYALWSFVRLKDGNGLDIVPVPGNKVEALQELKRNFIDNF